jgi:hypothetical protein
LHHPADHEGVVLGPLEEPGAHELEAAGERLRFAAQRWPGLKGTASGLAVVDTGADRSLLDVDAVSKQLASERPPLERVDRDLQPWYVRCPELSWGDGWAKLAPDVRIEACCSHGAGRPAIPDLAPPWRRRQGQS